MRCDAMLRHAPTLHGSAKYSQGEAGDDVASQDKGGARSGPTRRGGRGGKEGTSQGGPAQRGTLEKTGLAKSGGAGWGAC